MKKHLGGIKRQQIFTIVTINFWAQFASYTLNAILILYLTKPLLHKGLGMSQTQAYSFYGLIQAIGYLMPLFGGIIADKVLGLRRSLLLGAGLVAIAYFLLMLSGTLPHTQALTFFILAYAFIPASNSLVTGTSSALVSKICARDTASAKTSMTLYYMSINFGALVAFIIAPTLFDSTYGPLSIFAVVFFGKVLAVLYFSTRYKLYDNIAEKIDKAPITKKKFSLILAYLAGVFFATLILLKFPTLSSNLISFGCALGLGYFLLKTTALKGDIRLKQLLAFALIIEAIIFFVLYNQMNTTLILFAQQNSNLNLFGFRVSPARYQIINPILIIGISFILPHFYARFPQFKIPYQFAFGTLLAGFAFLVLWIACSKAHAGIIEGNYIFLTYLLLTISELFVSAIGLSMIGLYCEKTMLGFAMGIWYIAISLANVLSAKLAKFVAIPATMTDKIQTLDLYMHYYFLIGCTAITIGLILYFFSTTYITIFSKRKIKIH